MSEKTKSMMKSIRDLFNALTQDEQVAIMVELYYAMYDGQKDEFLEETENA